MEKINLDTLVFTHFGYKRFTQQECYSLLQYYKIQCVDGYTEQAPNALCTVYVGDTRYNVLSLTQLQYLTQEVEKIRAAK